MVNKVIGYIGTYTKGNSEGIYSFELDYSKEKITEVNVGAKLDNPTYLNLDKSGKYLFAVAKQGENGGVVSYTVNQESGALTKKDEIYTEGSSPCYVSTLRNEWITSSFYHRGSLEAYKLSNEGSFTGTIAVATHSGSGPNPERQEKPHVHYSEFTPDGKYIAVCDLGIDQLVTYKLESENLVEAHRLHLKPGSGPRHLVFHPNGEYAYLMTELSNEVIVLQYDQAEGSFKELQYISTIPNDFTENSQGSAIHISKDGRFVYAANRGHNSIAIFAVNQENGKLEFVDYTPTNGDWPRDFVLDPTDEYVLVSNQNSSNLVLYKRNKETGKLTFIQSDITVPDPVCVKFLPL